MNREKITARWATRLAALSGEGGAIARLGAAERRLERSAGAAPELLESGRRGPGPGADRGRRGRGRAGGARCATWRANAARWSRSRSACSPCATPRASIGCPSTHCPPCSLETRASDWSTSTRVPRPGASRERAPRERRERLSACRAARSRRGAARGRDRLAKAVEAELPPLRLERATVRVQLDPLPEEDWGADGAESVAFEVCTNPGQPFGPLAKIASGGELSRFMLASRWCWRVSILRRP